MKQKTLVITGMGAVTPIGIGVAAYWEALKAGRCGVGPVSYTHLDGYKRQRQQRGRYGAHQDQAVVIGADAGIDELAQPALADHCRQYGPAYGIDRGHAQAADDGRQRQRYLDLVQPLRCV